MDAMLYKLLFYIKEISKLFFSLEGLWPKLPSSLGHCQSLHKSKHRSKSSFQHQHSQATPQTSALVKRKIIVTIFQMLKNLFKFCSFLPNSLFLKSPVWVEEWTYRISHGSQQAQTLQSSWESAGDILPAFTTAAPVGTSIFPLLKINAASEF